MCELDWTLNRAVGLFSGLQGESLENGNFPIDSQRLSGFPAAKVQQLVLRRLVDVKEARISRAFLGHKKDIL